MSLLFPAPDSPALKTAEVPGWRPSLHTATRQTLVCLPPVTAVSRRPGRLQPGLLLQRAGQALCMCVNFLQELISQPKPAKGGGFLE